MAHSNLSTKVCRSSDVTYTQIDNDLVMMGSQDNLLYGVNALGTEIWSLLEFSALPLSEISQYIQQKYEVTETQCIEDIKQFINMMLDQKFLMLTD